ncbi:hypothetical protein CF70_012035 [Cupriavidus sp. SK-3]|uniref:hypothetical protein n=1 Tax=Cupriavidus sp. SK-3 TaxID=1470558 RepID=UPI000452EA86|nr:hypothetical protein [Cupriavidus sp. SK-3]KDP85764.1 hypothetical protein CF70_012035 [Cupriavidus sp. SK-3]
MLAIFWERCHPGRSAGCSIGWQNEPLLTERDLDVTANPAGINPSPPRELIDRAIGVWMRELEAYPGWKEWRRGTFARTLYDDGIPWPEDEEHLNEFVFSPEIERQHDLVMQYLGIEQAIHALQDCEYYFRRFPFRGLPVSKHVHLTYMCEMYFNRFYELRERIKKYLNVLAKFEPRHRIDIGQFLKQFDRDFDQELRERNQVHHHRRFEDLAIDRIFLSHAISTRRDGWAKEADYFYRKATQEWAQRVRIRASRAEKYVDAVAQTTLEGSGFLKPLTVDAGTPDTAQTG